jgi:hypothetical protein
MVLWTANIRNAKRGGIAGMGVCVDDVLASVRGVVDLAPHEALDEAQDFLTRQGYSVTYRTTTTLTVERQVSDNATGQESMFELIVLALPQSGGGVRIKVRGNDRETVRDQQAAWLEWSETLPKRETEQPEAAATTESVTRETVGQEAPRHTTAADNDVPERRYCTNCGQQLAENDRFCANCGTPVHEAAHMPTPEAERPRVPPATEGNVWVRLSSKQRIPITVSPEQAMEQLRQFFALDFRTGRDYDLYYDSEWGLYAKEVYRTAPLLLVVHIVLTVVTFGVWLIVWILIELVQRGQRMSIDVTLFEEENSDGYIVQLSGSVPWVQTTEAFVRRSLVNGGEGRPISS